MARRHPPRPTTLDRTSSPIRWHSSKARAGHG